MQEVGSYKIETKDHNGYRNRINQQDASVLEDFIGNRLATEVRDKAAAIAKEKAEELNRWKVEHDADKDQYYAEHTDQYSNRLRYYRDPLHTVHPDRIPAAFPDKDAVWQFISGEVYSGEINPIVLDNLDDVVGGDQGMTAFYDKRLVNYIKKYTKKWGGKVGKITLSTDEGDQSFWSVPVTDKMKDSVLRDGQPMFALKDRGVLVVDPKRVIKPGRRNFLRAEILKYLEKYKDRPFFNEAIKENIWVGRKGLEHSGTGAVEFNNELAVKIMPYLPDILRHAKPYKSEADKRQRLDIEKIIKLRTKIQIRDDQYFVDVVIRSHKDKKQRFHDHRVRGKDPAGYGGDSLHNLMITEVSLHPTTGSDTSIIDQRKAEKFPSKTKGGDTRYALKSDIPTEVEDVITSIHAGLGKPRKWTDRVKHWLKEHPAVGTKKGWYQGTLDSFHSIAEMERGSNDGKLMEAAQSAYKAALRTKNREGVMTALLGKGTLTLENGSVVFRKGSKGFLDVMEPIAEKGELELWETWAASNWAVRAAATVSYWI